MGNKPFERQRWTSVDGVENLLDRKKRGEGCLRRGHAQLQFVQAKEKNLDIVYSRVLKRMLCEILPISRADVNKKDDLGLTPLTYAVEASAGRLIVESLLDWKADVNSKDFLGQKVFVHAIFKQHGHRALETAQMLLEANADVDTQDNRGRTPLMLAAMMLPVASDKLKWLVEKAGAALNVCDDEGNTAYDLAALAHRRIAFALHEKTSVDQGPFATYLMNYQRPENSKVVVERDLRSIEMLHAEIMRAAGFNSMVSLVTDFEAPRFPLTNTELNALVSKYLH